MIFDAALPCLESTGAPRHSAGTQVGRPWLGSSSAEICAAAVNDVIIGPASPAR